jgi:uncharacterized protein (DUF952 family)
MAYYKILRAPEWEAFAAKGRFAGSPVDLKDGYVHLSTAEQVQETAARHFAGEEGLVLLTLDKTRLDPALKWEPSRGGALFPHLYRELAIEDVIFNQNLPLEGGRHVFPPL